MQKVVHSWQLKESKKSTVKSKLPEKETRDGAQKKQEDDFSYNQNLYVREINYPKYVKADDFSWRPEKFVQSRVKNIHISPQVLSANWFLKDCTTNSV